VCTENPARGLSLTGRGEPGAFSLREEAPPYGITSFTLSRPFAAIATHRLELCAAVFAHALFVVFGDVADALTLPPLFAISIGVAGMLAEPALTLISLLAVLDRYLGSRSSEAVIRPRVAVLLGKSGKAAMVAASTNTTTTDPKNLMRLNLSTPFASPATPLSRSLMGNTSSGR